MADGVMMRRRVRHIVAAVSLVVLSLMPLHAQSRVADLNAAGWKALRDGYGDRAAAYFGEALTLRPNDPVLLFGAGAAAHALGQQVIAMDQLTRALELKPNLTDASKLLGQIAFDEGEVDLAIRTYENALKYAPHDAGLVRALAKVRQEDETHHTFEDRRFERFRVMFEGPAEQELATEATSIFDSAFFRIGNTLGEYPANTIVAVLYTDKQFRDITRAPEWSGGQYDGRIRIPVGGASQNPRLFERVLTHELTHAVIAGIAPRGVPAWLHEGLAQYFDGTDPKAAQRRLKAFGRWVPLRNLEGGFGHLSAAQAQIAYDESLLAVSVMADRPAFGWIRLLHRLADGETFSETIGNFGFSYDDLEAPFAH